MLVHSKQGFPISNFLFGISIFLIYIFYVYKSDLSLCHKLKYSNPLQNLQKIRNEIQKCNYSLENKINQKGGS